MWAILRQGKQRTPKAHLSVGTRQMSTRPVEASSRRAADVIALRQAEQARPAVQPRPQAPVTPQVRTPVAARDEFVSAQVANPKPAETKLPAKAEDLPKLFPELKDAPKEKLEKAYKAM